MRTAMVAVSALALLAADGAAAQRVVMAGPGTSYGAPGAGAGVYSGYSGTRPVVASGSRWGSRVGGHWWAGMNAPGGWNAYRRPRRGWSLPSYWVQPNFAIADWSSYGLGAPPAGYGWTRYYDDAVLIDGDGRVYDDVTGVNWDGGQYAYDDAGGYAATSGYAATTTADYSGYTAGNAPGYVQPTFGQSTYAPPPAPAYQQPTYQQPAYQQPAYPAPAPYAASGAGYPPPAPYGQPGYVERRNSGVAGGVVGGLIGAGAGYAIGGRGNRVAGTLIGAGVGGAAGYAIDRSSSHRVPVAPSYGAGYGYPAPAPYPATAGASYPPPPPYPVAPAYPPVSTWRSGGTTVSTTAVGGYYGGGTTVVTVQSAPVVTTTTTTSEVIEDHVTYTRPHVWHRPVARHKWIRRSCGC